MRAGRGRHRPARRRRHPAGALARAARGRAHEAPARRRGRPSAARSADTPTVKAEGEVFTKCPNRDCPERRWQLLKHFVSRGAMDIDGLGEKQVAQLQQEGLRQDAAATTTASTAEQLTGARGLRPGPRRTHGGRHRSARKDVPFGRVLFARRHRGGRLRHRAQPRPAVPHDRRAAGRHARGDRGRRRASGPKMAERIAEQLADQQMRDLIEDLRREGVALRARGPAARRGPAGGQDLRADRHAPRPHARAGQRAHRGRRRAGHVERVEEDRLRRRRRERGSKLDQGRVAGRRRARRGRAARAPRWRAE